MSPTTKSMSHLDRRISVGYHQLLDKGSLPARVKTLRNTKIVCTLGPASWKKDQIVELLKAGMNVARLNFSHGDHETHKRTIGFIRAASEECGITCAILLDNKGPEIRTGILADGGKEVKINAGDVLNLHCNVDSASFEGTAKDMSCDYKDLPNVVKMGSSIKIDDGLVLTEVCKIDQKAGIVSVNVMNTAMLGQRKGVNLPGIKVTLPTLTPRDRADLLFGIEQKVDCMAISFCRKAADIKEIRDVLKSKEGASGIMVIAKIENQEGLDNFNEILEAADGIMVARGDLGVEIPLEKVVIAQKMMIKKCNLVYKPVITATQMLESMVYNPRPTRAEATDVANAVLDGTDCVMLSGESAKGKYPQQAVTTMASIVVEAEKMLLSQSWARDMRRLVSKERKKSKVEVIASSAVRCVEDLGAKGIVCMTQSGTSARCLAKFKAGVPIVTLSPDDRVSRQCLLSFGLQPFHTTVQHLLMGGTLMKGIDLGKVNGWFKDGDTIVLIKGVDGIKGTTNTLQVVDL